MTNINKDTISKYENGNSSMKIYIIDLLLEFYDVNIAYFFNKVYDRMQNIEKTEIEIYDADITEDEEKQNLLELYKAIYEVADEQREKGKNVDNWFYTKEQVEKMRKSGEYRFI